MPSASTSVEEYLAALPAERRATLEAVRKLIRESVDPLLEEGMQYGMLGYYVPHRVYPAGYHANPKEPLPFLALASQKQNLALYLMHLDAEELEWFRSAWAKAGKKLDMGKSCLRFRKLDELALDVLEQALRRTSVNAFIERYEKARAGSANATNEPRSAAKKTTSKKATSKKTTSKKATSKKKASKKPR